MIISVITGLLFFVISKSTAKVEARSSHNDTNHATD